MINKDQDVDQKIKDLYKDLDNYLSRLGVPERERLYFGHGVSIQTLINKFGIIVCVVEQQNVGYVTTKINEFYPNYKIVYVTPQGDYFNKNLTIFFELVKSGYVRWLRVNLPRLFRQLIIDQRVGYKIIKRRLEIYGDSPKHAFWRSEDEAALEAPLSYIASMEPSYFDFIPEEELL